MNINSDGWCTLYYKGLLLSSPFYRVRKCRLLPQYFVLTHAGLQQEWRAANNCVESMILSFVEGDFAGEDRELDMERQIRQTANTFAVDMILLKFVQGLPLVGMIGGAGNPVYYNKVMKYVELKYRKRYLLTLRKKAREIGNE